MNCIGFHFSISLLDFASRFHWENYSSRLEAQQDVLDYIVICYNSSRLHSTLDYRSPNDFEKETDLKLAA